LFLVASASTFTTTCSGRFEMLFSRAGHGLWLLGGGLWLVLAATT
jgi:hypothetical protein